MRTLLITPLLFVLLTMASVSLVAAQQRTVKLDVDNMTCATCEFAVAYSLRKVNGVISAKADIDTTTATVTFDPKKTNVETLTKATTNAGYPSRLKKETK